MQALVEKINMPKQEREKNDFLSKFYTGRNMIQDKVYKEGFQARVTPQ